ncbi:S41 family peptidase [Hymenobacter sp. GOD-10R]|uniref:S41 family peptidase n=1 Tax=Hymenobacter sp. GOD-10R TaxID=3093922 RepID=UPI002D77E960|nr:S41 family peptidase [Hymenobacter sp. GOD-10R]WRQ28995.1 S41 family peptidase [Hymenobacter sp. GOD-10R]
MKILLLAISLLVCVGVPEVSGQTKLTPQQYRQDFDFFWETIHDNYAYFDKKQTDWYKVRQLYQPQADTIRSRRAFVRLLENAFMELYDNHASLATNRFDSQRLVPSGSDLHAEFVAGKAIVLDVRQHLGAEKVGIRPGMEVVAIGGVPIEQAIQPFVGKALHTVDAEARNYALDLALAGAHHLPRKLSVRTAGGVVEYQPDQPVMLQENVNYPRKVETRVLGKVGYIRINNCLFDNGLMQAFDSALTTMLPTSALILDLRDTPSGGNTTVARAILGRFITTEQAYQEHELVSEERVYGVKRKWRELVSPRPAPYTRPVAVLANHWTASMGEGITIAFDALKRATVVGTELARLNGAIYSYKMPNSGIGFNFPAEKLYHLKGTPREKYRPNILVDLRKANPASNQDLILETALKLLN